MNSYNEIQTLARNLMNQHNLTHWKLFLNPRKKKCNLGLCKHHIKTIELNLGWCLKNSEFEVRKLILHEISHSLVGPGHKHDKIWKEMCIEIGGSGFTRHVFGTAINIGKRKKTFINTNSVSLKFRTGMRFVLKAGDTIKFDNGIIATFVNFNSRKYKFPFSLKGIDGKPLICSKQFMFNRFERLVK